MALADVGGPHWGTVALNVIGTKLQEWKRQDLPGGAFTDRKGTISNTFGLTLPEWKFLSTLSWNYDPFSLGVRWRYQGSVENFNNREQVLDAVNYFDLNGSWKLNETVTVPRRGEQPHGQATPGLFAVDRGEHRPFQLRPGRPSLLHRPHGPLLSSKRFEPMRRSLLTVATGATPTR
ncbi:hypothetical protein [Phenylobacterium sp. J367]|uniref:hypothetical protein n=1 Tax=Phenylobacterium sp. J367 TaxID=2898435 RepID=UPI002151B130|nr:hypothetical protein [Phenylobacterium sp. J367]MCR5880167.1 hypothetical protein [Phenylobacterium sp. J367]